VIAQKRGIAIVPVDRKRLRRCSVDRKQSVDEDGGDWYSQSSNPYCDPHAAKNIRPLAGYR
jgi:hypothetical protein